jgi:hypothetical protein
MADIVLKIHSMSVLGEPIDREAFLLSLAPLPTAEFNHIIPFVDLLISRLNAVVVQNYPSSALLLVKQVINSLFAPSNETLLRPSGPLYFHGLALAVKTLIDLSKAVAGEELAESVNDTRNDLIQRLTRMNPNIVSGWDEAAINALRSDLPMTKEVVDWALVFGKDAYLNVLLY